MELKTVSQSLKNVTENYVERLLNALKHTACISACVNYGGLKIIEDCRVDSFDLRL